MTVMKAASSVSPKYRSIEDSSQIIAGSKVRAEGKEQNRKWHCKNLVITASEKMVYMLLDITL